MTTICGVFFFFNVICNMSGTKLAEDCCKYGTENSQNIDENILAKAAAIYGDARKHVEKEQEDFNKLLSSQVCLQIYLFLSSKKLH